MQIFTWKKKGEARLPSFDHMQANFYMCKKGFGEVNESEINMWCFQQRHAISVMAVSGIHIHIDCFLRNPFLPPPPPQLISTTKDISFLCIKLAVEAYSLSQWSRSNR